MAFVSCKACDWSQDDFWDEHYNPIRVLARLEPQLLDFENLDEQFTGDPVFNEKHGTLSRRHVIAKGLRDAAKAVEGMKFLTDENIRDKRCPQCGLKELDID